MGNPKTYSSDNQDPQGTAGIQGNSSIFNGVLGYTTAEGHAGVAGACDEGLGNGVYGRSKNRVGVYAVSENYEAVHAVTNSSKTAAIAAYNLNVNSDAPSLYAKKRGKGCSAVFDGKVNIVEGDLKILKGTIYIKDVDIVDLLYKLSAEIAQLKSRVMILEI
ncbi:MAG TPA: hypothetical protein PLX80_13150 [Ignavibacteria bacterium]|nr:hypothetical protein [Ignavibacteria bacterium]